MEIRHGPSSISIIGDKDEGLKHVKQARRLLYSLRERLKVGGIESLSGQLRIPGAPAYIQASVGLAGDKAVIYAEGAQVDAEQDGQTELATYPDFVSGITLQRGLLYPFPGLIPETFGVRFQPTATSRRKHGFSGDHLSNRLAVKPHPDMQDAFGEPPDWTGPPFSQATICTGSLYSGRMAEVVQFLLGVGVAKPPSIYEQSGTGEPEADGDPYRAEVASLGARVVFDYRHSRTHGVTLAADGRIWVLEISIHRGVIAMPLDLWPETQTDEFMDLLQELGDTEAIAVVERFGGFPTGRGLPSGPMALAQALASGIVVQLLEASALTPFYSNTSYSAELGWTFSDDGREAHNTAWRYGEDGIQRGVHFAVRALCGASTPIDSARGADLRTALAGFVAEPADRWTIRKVARLDDDTLRDLTALASARPAQAWSQLQAITLSPVAACSASLAKLAEGKLWAGPSAQGPQMKFPVSGGELVSHDFRPFPSVIPFSGRCDTIMHVCHIDGSLHTVRYFYDTSTGPAVEVDDGFEDCMFQGEYVRTTHNGGRSVGQTFYSTAIDNRQENAPSVSIDRVVTTPVGYSDVVVGNDPTYPPAGQLSRTMRFRRQTTSEIVTGRSTHAACAVGWGARDSYYIATANRQGSSSFSSVWGHVHLGDPWSYITWRNFPGYTGTFLGGTTFQREDHPDGCGPVDANTVTSEVIYAPYPCSEFADNGSWADTCENADALVYNLPPPALPAPIATVSHRPVDLQVWLVIKGGALLAYEDTRTIDNWMNPWFLRSGDAGIAHHIQCRYASLGQFCVTYQQTLNGPAAIRGNPNTPAMAVAPLACNFVGVNDA